MGVDDDLKGITLTEKGRAQLFNSGGAMHGPIIIRKHFDELSPMQSEVYVVLRIVQFIGNFLTNLPCSKTFLKDVETNQPGFINDLGRYWFMTAPNGMLYSKARISL